MRLGISLVPEGRRLFPSLSVEENLQIGAYGRRNSGYWSLARIYDLFPALVERREAPSQTLSGGEQQMAAIGRALMSNPRVLLCDEISLGLAPIVIRHIYAALPQIKAQGRQRDPGGAGHRAGAAGGRPGLLLPGRAHVADRAAGRARPRKNSYRVFRRMSGWINTLLQGVMLGGLYALFAAGLSLIFGMMRLVNLAHGDLIVLAAFVVLG